MSHLGSNFSLHFFLSATSNRHLVSVDFPCIIPKMTHPPALRILLQEKMLSSCFLPFFLSFGNACDGENTLWSLMHRLVPHDGKIYCVFIL